MAFQQGVVQGSGDAIARDPDATGGVALGIGIDKQRFALGGGEGSREVHGGRRLADPAFLISERDYACHR
jgi:hypothetical protein